MYVPSNKCLFSKKRESENERPWWDSLVMSSRVGARRWTDRPCAYVTLRLSDCVRVTPHDRGIISDLSTSHRAVPEQGNELNPACARTRTRRKHRGYADASRTSNRQIWQNWNGGHREETAWLAFQTGTKQAQQKVQDNCILGAWHRHNTGLTGRIM